MYSYPVYIEPGNGNMPLFLAKMKNPCHVLKYSYHVLEFPNNHLIEYNRGCQVLISRVEK